MRKILSILASLGIVSTASTSVIACSKNKATKWSNDDIKDVEIDGEPILNDENSIFVKLKGIGELQKNKYVSPKDITVQDNEVTEAYISMNYLEIYLKNKIIAPTGNKTLSLNISISISSKKVLKTKLILKGKGGEPGNLLPLVSPTGEPNDKINEFTFVTKNISDSDNVDIKFVDDLPNGISLTKAFIKSNLLTLNFSSSFKQGTENEIYRFKFTVGQIILNSSIEIYRDNSLPSFSSVKFINGNNLGPDYIVVNGENFDKLVKPSWSAKTFSIKPNDLSWQIIGFVANDDESEDLTTLKLQVMHDNPLPTTPQELKLIYDYQGIHLECSFTVKA